MDLRDRFRGCMLGLAAGDALGMPVEGLSSLEIAETVGRVNGMLAPLPGHFHTGLRAGQYTDDTEETILLARSILDCHGFSGNDFADKLASWGSAWTLSDARNRGVGFTTRASVEALIQGVPWQESGLDLPTCGSAMRVAPIGLVYNRHLDLVNRYAQLQSIPTHNGPEARAGAVAVAVGVAMAVRGFSPANVLEAAASQASKVSPGMGERLQALSRLLEMEPERVLAQLGNSPAVYETVPAAFYCFLRFSDLEALVIAASAGGDTDSIASMAGALLGASRGTSWIPDTWLESLEAKETLCHLADGLAQLSQELGGD